MDNMALIWIVSTMEFLSTLFPCNFWSLNNWNNQKSNWKGALWIGLCIYICRNLSVFHWIKNNIAEKKVICFPWSFVNPWGIYLIITPHQRCSHTHIAFQTKGIPHCMLEAPLQHKRRQMSQYSTFLRHITVRLKYSTLCGKLFLTWLTLNEVSDEKKMPFSPQSWALQWALCKLCVCVFFLDCFHRIWNKMSYQFINYTC